MEAQGLKALIAIWRENYRGPMPVDRSNGLSSFTIELVPCGDFGDCHLVAKVPQSLCHWEPGLVIVNLLCARQSLVHLRDLRLACVFVGGVCHVYGDR